MTYRLDVELDKLKELSDDDQIEIMRNWFFDNYQDPEGECPYDPEEGDYVYIWGGPYSAEEELNSEFEEYIKPENIQKLVNELDTYCFDWSAISTLESNEPYSDNYLEYENAFKRFNNNIELLENLLESIDEKKLIIKYMIYAYCVSILESFLNEEFKYQVLSNESYLEIFFKKNMDFKNEKISLNDIFEKMNSIKNIANNYLSNVLWHNLFKISSLYKDVLGIVFPENIAYLHKAIIKRHDIVHRCGRNKEGSEIIISKSDIAKLIDEIKQLVNYINSKTDKILF